MNLYDFDKTIYDGDSTIDFYLYCLRRQPKILKKLPKQVLATFKYLIRLIDKTKYKSEFYSFLIELDDVDYLLIEFWNINDIKIKKWYISQRKNDDIVISASPSFLLEPICKKLQVGLIASKVNKVTGQNLDKNCYGEQKVIRFLNEFPNSQIDNFYSDSKSDLPLARISVCSYIVRKNELIRWKI